MKTFIYDTIKSLIRNEKKIIKLLENKNRHKDSKAKNQLVDVEKKIKTLESTIKELTDEIKEIQVKHNNELFSIEQKLNRLESILNGSGVIYDDNII